MRFIFVISVLVPLLLVAQTKEYSIIRVSQAPVIDGNIQDDYWKDVSSAGQFLSYIPVSGTPISQSLNTQWKAVYDNQAIYFAIYMYDSHPDSIMTQWCKRDKIYGSNNDYVSLYINPYRDGQTDFCFKLTADAIQEDLKIGQDYEDENWDMVWQGETSMDDKGWYAEFKIPYSALRFAKSDLQDWSFNIQRHVRRSRTTYSWNKLDLTRDDISAQAGIITGLKNIEPPLRLSFLPYVSSYASNYDDETSVNVNGGLDLKYGINESFTLDMTLIPDFGQVGFDNRVLNLSPFEIQYDEKRPFFTEGTELFTKSGLFYSRRISDNLINASKVTGKTKGNLGIGVLNAVANETENLPLSNYNIVTLDQSLNNNSYVSLTNTNVNRKAHDKANVTGITSLLRNPSNSYQLNTTFNWSHVRSNGETNTGFASNVLLSKISGKFQYFIENNIESNTYDPNDMGFLYNNNELSYFGGISYKIDKPTSRLIEFKSYINASLEYLYSPYLFSKWEIEGRQISTFKNYLTWGVSTEIIPVEENDFFEARTTLDDVFKRSPFYELRTFFSSDYRKKIALDVSFGGGRADLYDEYAYFFRFSPRVRFNQKLFMYYVFSTKTTENESGYITKDNDTPIFSIRNKQFFTNVLTGQYVMNNKMSFDFKFRHHWEQVRNYSFHELDQDGYLTTSSFMGNQNVNFNAWNIDFSFNYWFAPGSELSVVWKNAILSEGNQVISYYRDNLEALLDQPQENSLSLKVRYYLDYLTFKRK